jgi:SAM-dependent methyltransferase
MIRKAIAVLAGTISIAAAFSFVAAGPLQQKRLDVPYVPTRYPVVDTMLKMAGVNDRDVLYDLGCGDGRIVITAARRFGARGVGIDIDPARIAECRESAIKEGVNGRVRFIEGDLFKADFHEATVMTLYLLTSVNLKLRPKLLTELRPGSRIVSHDFMMDSWKPDVTINVEADALPHTVHLWIVPANISGIWKWTTGRPKTDWELNIEQDFQHPLGSLKMNGTDVPLKGITLRGDRLSITTEDPPAAPGPGFSAVFHGRAFGHTISGKVDITSKGKTRRSDWKAVRNPVTQRPLDIPAEGN